MDNDNIIIDKTIKKQCQFCNQFKYNIWHIIDPFAFEIYDDQTEYDICDECYHNRKDDI